MPLMFHLHNHNFHFFLPTHEWPTVSLSILFILYPIFRDKLLKIKDRWLPVSSIILA